MSPTASLVLRGLLLVSVFGAWCLASPQSSMSMHHLQAVCPMECDCGLDEGGRRRVSCRQGGMRDPIPVTSMPSDAEVIIIEAPPEGPSNNLTIGPIFQAFPRLEELRVVGSGVPAIGRHSFWGVPALRTLDLSGNRLTALLDHHFVGLADLRYLRLDNNRIESAPSASFRHLHELNTLSLAHNRLKELVPRLFFRLGKLRNLDLSHNALGSLDPEVLKDVRQLRKLHCRDCGLTSLDPDVLRLLHDLEDLDLGDNNFEFLSVENFKPLRRLERLMLDGNRLSVVLDGAFSGPRLAVLSLARNRLAKIAPGAFNDNPALLDLDISDNRLERVEASVLSPLATTLTAFHISGNPFSPDAISFALEPLLPKIQVLSLSRLGLRSIPTMAPAPALRVLNMSGNALSRPPLTLVSSLNSIRILDLSDNAMRGLDVSALRRLDTALHRSQKNQIVPELRLGGNPWACDRCNAAMIRWANGSDLILRACESPLGVSCPDCHGPRGLAGRRLGSLDPDSLPGCGEGYGTGEGPGALLEGSVAARAGLVAASAAAAGLALLLVTAGIAACACRRRHAAHYYTREDKRGTLGQHEEEDDDGGWGPEECLNGGTEKKAWSPQRNGKVAPPGVTITHPDVKHVSIATIDEITRDPELGAALTARAAVVAGNGGA
ncbi:insulin-like growth factor-binding protein complex acid labile subunit [Ischnura elegans]|uniref:insulin-like growth factor-binding protein complex acid labile subunit n=1 Tax=Ischnura elegans TaxID=197161 RepID=UPI001ED89238|nr:insulin-like growth factor-binding protein complex acid labile subunit [Ischnura elegans]